MERRNFRQRGLKKSIARAGKRIEALKDLENRYSWCRLIVFFGGIGISFALYWVAETFSWASLGATLIIFNIVAYFHRRIKKSIKSYRIWQKIKSTQLARMMLDWENIPDSSFKLSGGCDHPFDLDLDITGRHSLHQLLDIAISHEGSRMLGMWLLERVPDPAKIAKRQQIVKELSRLPGFRDKLLLNFKQVSESRLDGKRFLDTVTTPKNSQNLRWLLPLLTVMSAVNIFLVLMNWLAGAEPYWLFTLPVYIIFYFLNYESIKHIFSDASFLDAELIKIRAMLRFLETYPYHKNLYLAEICRPFWEVQQRPSRKIKKIRRVVAAVGLRMNPGMAILLNLVVPWDFYIASRLEKCKAALAEDLPVWMEAWSTIEAMISLANFAWLNPDTSFPEIVERGSDAGQVIFVAHQLGHPLLPSTERICNDFSLNSPGEMVLITGSNMAGKSTFLKTLGVNLVLAYAGGPVSVGYLRTSLFRLFTSIKVSDSVTDGVSFFYAEVRRLKALLNALQQEHPYPLFFLIDEIFRGTNNRERFIGSRSYIRTLAGQNGVGAISTHDLELTRLADENERLFNYHFREEIINGKMVFDYKLHPGPCPTTNALLIMKMEGLPVKE
jgi:ABC-type multidrug transport system fused ATPase/permease subunit